MTVVVVVVVSNRLVISYVNLPYITFVYLMQKYEKVYERPALREKNRKNAAKTAVFSESGRKTK